MKLYVVRHGQTNENNHTIMQGNMDTELNEKGVEQAKSLIDKISSLNIDLIVSSPLKRAYHTASIISNGNIEIICDDRLKSRNHGEFQGMKRLDINLDEYWNIKINKQYEKAESVMDLYNRIDSLLKDIKDKYQDKTVLIVTHSGICRILYYYFNGIPDDGNLTAYESTTCSFEEYNL